MFMACIKSVMQWGRTTRCAGDFAADPGCYANFSLLYPNPGILPAFEPAE
jgi:hypothetical protein